MEVLFKKKTLITLDMVAKDMIIQVAILGEEFQRTLIEKLYIFLLAMQVFFSTVLTDQEKTNILILL